MKKTNKIAFMKPIFLLFCFIISELYISYFGTTATKIVDQIIKSLGFNTQGTHLSLGFFVIIILLAIVLPIACSIRVKVYIYKLKPFAIYALLTYIFLFIFGIYCAYKFIYGWF